jgi:hypothetical protein
MSLDLKEVRVPTPRVRAERILALLEAHGPLNEYNAAGAIDPGDGVALIRATAAAMALTLADGNVSGETMLVKLIDFDEAIPGTAVLTPANFTNGATMTFDAKNESEVLIWDEVAGAWEARVGGSSTIA